MAGRHRAGQGVPAVGVAVVEGPRPEVLAQKRLMHPSRGDGGRQGQVPAGDALAQTHKVGPDAAQVAGEQGAGAAEPGGHLVADQQHPPGPGRLGEGRHLVRVGDQHPGRPLDQGLDHRRGQLGAVLVEGGHRLGDPVRIVVAGGADRREPQRIEQVGAEAAVAHRQRPDGVAVVGPPEGQVGGAAADRPVAPVLEGDLEGLLHRGRPVGGEQEAGAVHRHHLPQGLG